MKKILSLVAIASLLFLPELPMAAADTADFKITEVRISSDNGATMRDFYLTFNEPAKEVSVDIAKDVDGAVWKTFSYSENLYQTGQKSFAVTISPLEENTDYKYTVNGRRVSDAKWAPGVAGIFTTKSGVSVLVISNMKVQKLTDLEEGARDFSYSVSTQNKTTATLTITDKSSNSIIFTKAFTDSAPYVTGLDPVTAYAYRIDIVDRVTGVKGYVEGVFSTGVYGKTISREQCNENNPWKLYCAADGTEKLISSCEAHAMGVQILHQGNCTAADLKQKTSESKIVVGLDRIYQAGQIANEETLSRDFSFNISGVDWLKAITKLEVYDAVTGAKHPEENYIQTHNVVTKLKPNTSYRYVYTVTDPATGRIGSAEGTFRTEGTATSESKIVVGLDRIYQAGQIANEETLSRDFSFNISGVDWLKAITKLEVYDAVTGAKHPEENYIQTHNVVTKLKPNTNYRYIYTVTDPATGKTGRAEGTFTTASVEYNKGQETSEEKKFTADQQIVDIQKKIDLFKKNQIDQILSELNELRNKVKEQEFEIKFLKKVSGDLKQLSEQMQQSINTFVTYGIDANTKNLGAGERAAVVNSFKAAYDKLPETDQELQDLFRIANGRFPSITNIGAEKTAKAEFRKIYKRVANMKNPQDSAAITVMAYGLRQVAENRNLKSESVGITIFRKIYGRMPQSTEDWNIMQAITYSGASRKPDSDKDGLSDEDEKSFGTDPKKTDTDSDGYLDGEEVENGHNPLGA